MNTRIPDKEIHSVAELLECVKKDQKLDNGPVWFRGHKSQRWRLLPSIWRS
jgi:hypothetical protein